MFVDAPWLLGAVLAISATLLREVIAAVIRIVVQDTWTALRGHRCRRKRRMRDPHYSTPHNLPSHDCKDEKGRATDDREDFAIPYY